MIKEAYKFLAIFLALCPEALAQVTPSATEQAANLRYSVRYAQTIEFGQSALSSWESTNVPSAEVDYSNGLKHRPFDLTYAGGYAFTEGGPSYTSGMFQRLLLSQGLSRPKFAFSILDDVSYRPEAPITGFSGIPGIGEAIATAPTPSAGPPVLTVNTHVVENTLTGTFARTLNFATGVTVENTYDVLRYPDNNGLSTNSETADGGFNFRVNARNLLTTHYYFAQYSYPDAGIDFTTNSTTIGFDRFWNRRLSTSISAGPQWISNSNGSALPTITAARAHAGLDYVLRTGSVSLQYIRSASAGSGYFYGATIDGGTAKYSRDLAKTLSLSLSGAGSRTTGLGSLTSINSLVAGVQVSKHMGKECSIFANYTAADQSSSIPLPTNILSTLTQITGFGISCSRNTHPIH